MERSYYPFLQKLGLLRSHQPSNVMPDYKNKKFCCTYGYFNADLQVVINKCLYLVPAKKDEADNADSNSEEPVKHSGTPV